MIKRIIKKVIITITLLLLLPAGLYIAFRSSSVQYYLTQKMVSLLSDKLHTVIKIGGVDIQFFNSIILENVYIEDLHGDTLLYASTVKAGMKALEFKKRKFALTGLNVKNAVFRLKEYNAENFLNIQFIIDALSDNDTIQKNWNILVDKVLLNNIRFYYINENEKHGGKGINYQDIEVTGIHSEIAGFEINADTISGKINRLICTEKCGFSLAGFSGAVKSTPVGLTVNELKILTKSSKVNTNLEFRYSGYTDYLEFIDSVFINSNFSNSTVGLYDLFYFAPSFEGLTEVVDLSGKVSGTVSKLKGKSIELNYGSKSRFLGSINLTGLPNLENTFISLQVNKLSTTQADLKHLPVPPFQNGKKLEVPRILKNLGNIGFVGEFTGFYNDFVAYGKIRTDLGDLSSDVLLKKDTVSGKITYSGKIASKSIDAGSLLLLSDYVGRASFNVKIEGSGIEKENAEARLDGLISSLEFNHYNYQNINLHGNIANRRFKGYLDVNDENIDINFNGDVDFTGTLPALNFSSEIKRANLYQLNFIKEDTSAFLSAKMTSNLRGSNIDNMTGTIQLQDIKYKDKELQQGNSFYDIGNIYIAAFDTGTGRSLTLNSEFATGEILGAFTLGEIENSIKGIASQILPSADFLTVNGSKYEMPEKLQDFVFNIKIINGKKLLPLISSVISFADGTQIMGEFHSKTNRLHLQVNSNSILFAENTFEKVSWNTELLPVNSTGAEYLEFNSGILCEKLYISDSIRIEQFNLQVKTENDKIFLSAKWDNESTPSYKGTLLCNILFNENELVHPAIDTARKWNNSVIFRLLPSQIIIADTLWEIQDNNKVELTYGFLNVENLNLHSGRQSLSVNGSNTRNSDDEIIITLSNIDVSDFSRSFQIKGIDFNGNANGQVEVHNLFTVPFISGKMQIEDLEINNTPMGKAEISSRWKKELKKIDLSGSLLTGSINSLMINGSYFLDTLEKNSFLFDIDVKNFKLKVFEPFIYPVLSEISKSALATGRLNLTGRLDNPVLTGKLMIERGGFKVPYLNTSYNFADQVVFLKDRITFENIVLNDMKGNTATLNGKITHKHFTDWYFDIQIAPDKLQGLNTSEFNNEGYYGLAFASGLINIYGGMDKIEIEISAKTEKGTKIIIPISNHEELEMNNYITFINPKVNQNPNDSAPINPKIFKQNIPALKMQVEATPEAEVRLIFDETIGDVLKVKGSGNLLINVNHKGELEMYGNYLIEEGDYLFTLKKVMNKRFKIENGGTINWTGDPYNASININAVYSLTASLYDLGLDLNDKRRVPVNCKLKMTGQLMNPDIAFDISFPDLDEQSKSKLLLLLNSEQEINNQMFSLLVLNQFQPVGDKKIGATGGVEANSTELLSNQLNNWLSQISEEFDIGVNYRPGDEITSKEVEVALSTQLFNDRLSINGSVANNPNAATQNSANIVGDFNLDYKITKDGQLRLKAYNRANDNYLATDKGPYSQGVGLAYKKEFASFMDLFRKKKKKTEELPNNN